MHSVRGNACKSMFASSMLLLAALSAVAAPLPRDAASANGDGLEGRRLSEADLALSDPRLDLPEISAANNYAQLLGTPGGRRTNSADPQAFDLGQPGSAQSLQEMLRGFVTVRRASGQSASAAQPRANNRRAADDAMGIDLGFSTDEWIRESVQGVVGSVLSLAVDERGNASFSMLGLGDFSVVISADRSELAFASGDEVLATARRTSTGPHPGAGYASHADGQGGYGPGAPIVPSESPLRRALELALEIASHPLSFIVYALIAGYALMWGLYSARAKRPRSGSGSRHSSSLYSVSSAVHGAAMIPTAAVKRVRKRMRMRVRVRKYR